VTAAFVAAQHAALDDLAERELACEIAAGERDRRRAARERSLDRRLRIDFHRLTTPKALRFIVVGTSDIDRIDRCGNTRSVIRRRWRRNSGAHRSTGITLLVIIFSTCTAIRASICSANRGSSTSVDFAST